MSYYYQDDKFDRIGPYSWDELKQLHLSGTVKPDTRVHEDGKVEPVLFKDLWARVHPGATSALPPPLSEPPPTASGPSFTQKARDDLRALTPHLLVPLQEIKS